VVIQITYLLIRNTMYTTSIFFLYPWKKPKTNQNINKCKIRYWTHVCILMDWTFRKLRKVGN